MPIIINLAQIEVLKTYGGQEMIEQSFTIFIEEAREIITTCKSSIKNANYQEISEAAHSLKGSAKTLGIIKLGDAAYKLEDVCNQNKSKQLASAFKAVEDCFEEFMKNYQAILKI